MEWKPVNLYEKYQTIQDMHSAQLHTHMRWIHRHKQVAPKTSRITAKHEWNFERAYRA